MLEVPTNSALAGKVLVSCAVYDYCIADPAFDSAVVKLHNHLTTLGVANATLASGEAVTTGTIDPKHLTGVPAYDKRQAQPLTTYKASFVVHSTTPKVACDAVVLEAARFGGKTYVWDTNEPAKALLVSDYDLHQQRKAP